MPVEISNIEGSLKGFDIVLALSEEAINASLQKLYDTAITDGPLPPPLLLPDFAPSPQATHFINHRLSLHRLNSKRSTPEKPVYLKAGIEGWIECPSVRFRPILDLGPSVSADAKYKNASVEIKFKKGPDGTSSFIKYYDREQESYDTLCLDGKTMAWSVKIGRLDVQDVMNDIIKKTVHNPPADEQLKKHVDSNLFTVSTVFCIFEHQEMVNTFTMLDKNRKAMTGDVTANAMADISGYFLGIQQTHGSSQIPENPFILGYGISQSPPDESRERATELVATALPYFIPKQFVLTVTPGDGIGQQWNTTSGTLNFCMLTQREGQYERIDISPTDANAGLFDKTFFDITKTLGKTKDDTGKIQGHDGIMAFSRQVMEDLWLRKIVQDIRLPLNDKFRKRVGFADLLVSQGDGMQKADYGYKSYQTWQTGTVGMDESDPYSKQQFAFGESIVQATMNSETANIQSVRDGINHARNLYLDIKTENRMTYVFQTHGINTMFVNEDKGRSWWSRRDGTPYPDQNKLKNYLNQGHWMLARTIELTVRSFVRLNIHAGRDGQWDIDVDESKSKNLFKPGEDLKFSAVADYQALPSFDNMTEYGNFYQFEKHNTYITCGQREADLHFTDSMKGWKTKSSQTVRDSLEGVVKGLGGCVIMPAGDVFSFAGLDTDDKGTVYAQCDYKNESGHKKTT